MTTTTATKGKNLGEVGGGMLQELWTKEDNGNQVEWWLCGGADDDDALP